MQPTLVALIYGGQSPEHEISVRSARNIYAAFDRQRWEPMLIGISKRGQWLLTRPELLAQEAVVSSGQPLMLCPGAEAFLLAEDGSPLPKPALAFPIVHGPGGEDGSLQGLLRLLGLPFVGPDVLGSALCMDKDFTKRILRDADLMVAEYLCFHAHEQAGIDFAAVRNRLGMPVFVKPANMGSSVGVRRAEDADSFHAAVAEAFRYDRKILIEEAISGREVECAVMGNEIPEASSVGEVKMGGGFYDYDSKYVSATAAEVLIPAPGLDEELLAKLRLIASSAYQALGCEGLSRVDMFVCDDGRVYVNEVNTLPGFTNISMYPKLWEQSGLPYGELISHLLVLALDKAEKQRQIVRSL
jgi:D-alanine-D-alanine ligase